MTTINSAQYLSLRISELAANRVDTSVPTTLSSAPVVNNVVSNSVSGNYSELLLRDTVSKSVELVGAIQVTQSDLDTIANYLTDIKSRRDVQATLNTQDANYQSLNTEIHDLEVNLSTYLGSRTNGLPDLVSRYSATQALSEKYFETVDAANLPLGMSSAEVGAVEIDIGAYLGSIHDANACPVCNPSLRAVSENAAPTNYNTSVTGALASSASGVSYIEPLRMGNVWNLSTGETLTYSYYDTANPVAYSGYPSASGLNPASVATSMLGYVAQLDSAFKSWDQVSSGLKFERVTESGNTVGELRVAYTDSVEKPAGSAAYAYGPGSLPINGDIWFDRTQASNQSFSVGSYGLLSAIHEIGHAIGLSHPFDGSSATGANLSPANDSLRTSVMSYTSTDRNFVLNVSNSGGGLTANFNTRIYSSTPMIYDVAAIQYLYGSSNDTRMVDSTYNWQVTPQILETIVDSGGVDTIDASNQVHANIINLNEGQFSSIGYWTQSEQLAYYDARYGAGTSNWLQTFINQTNTAYGVGSVLYTGQDNIGIAYGAVIENAIGGSAADTLTGNAASNALTGGAGNDTLDGGAGTDTVFFGGLKSNYTIVQSGNDWTVTDNVGTDGTDTLSNVEYFSFADVLYDPLTQAAIDHPSQSKAAGKSASASKDMISKISLKSSGLLNMPSSKTVQGDGKNNRLFGSSSSELIEAGAGNDWVDAGAGNDVIVGGNGAGNDVYLGGAGEDTLKYTSAKAGLRINLAAGFAGSLAGSDAAGIGVDAMSEVENVIASRFDDVITGDAGNNKIAGFGGSDTIDGGLGDDTVVFAKSRDNYTIKKSGLGYSIKDGTNTTYVTRVEYLEFADGNFKLKSISRANDQSAEITTRPVDASLAKQALDVLNNVMSESPRSTPSTVSNASMSVVVVNASSPQLGSAQPEQYSVQVAQVNLSSQPSAQPMLVATTQKMSATVTTSTPGVQSATDRSLTYLNRQRTALNAMVSTLTQRVDTLSGLINSTKKTSFSIVGTEYAQKTAQLAKQTILQQVGMAAMASANTSTQGVLQLLK